MSISNMMPKNDVNSYYYTWHGNPFQYEITKVMYQSKSQIESKEEIIKKRDVTSWGRNDAADLEERMS